MIRRSLIGLLLAFVPCVFASVGCDSPGTTTTAPEGHDGKSATGHTGGMPAAGPDSPEAKAAAKKATPTP
jgi:hypothetical protein